MSAQGRVNIRLMGTCLLAAHRSTAALYQSRSPLQLVSPPWVYVATLDYTLYFRPGLYRYPL